MLAETGVPPEKRTKLAQTMEDMMSNIVEQAISKSDLRWEARCEELMSRFMAKVDEKIAASEKLDAQEQQCSTEFFMIFRCFFACQVR